MKISQNEIKKHQISGFYKDVPLMKNQNDNRDSDTVEQTIQRLEGMTASASDKIHTVLEVHTNLDLGEDDSGLALPYIITIDYESQTSF
jgi:hypothetical protein